MYEQPKTWKIGPSFLAGGFLFALGLNGVFNVVSLHLL